MSAMQQLRGRQLSASDLEVLGKTAARLSHTSGISLTEAAVRTLEPEGLNAEQIRRCVEQANVAAVNDKFASLSGVDRIVHIDGGPADPATVIDALHAHAASAPGARLMATEYATAPSYTKVATRVAARPPPDLPGLQRKLAAAHDELSDMCTGIEFRMEMKFAELEDSAHRALREGATLCDLASAWSERDPALAKVAAHRLGAAVRWGEKTAGVRVSQEHPAMTRFEDFRKVAAEYARAVEARRDVETQLSKVAGFLARTVS